MTAVDIYYYPFKSCVIYCVKFSKVALVQDTWKKFNKQASLEHWKMELQSPF